MTPEINMKRLTFLLVSMLALGLALTALSFALSIAQAQRSVRVQGRAGGAEKRVALVIGNSNYGRNMGRLVNPANDAEDMARVLRGLKFEVTLLADLDKRGMEEALNDFSLKAEGSAVALFFFAGHGVQVERVNYLVPLRANMRRQLDAKYEAMPANKVVDYMKASGARANIVILDACRNNPLPKSGRSAGKGLAAMQAGTGTLIAFAAGSGQEADENPRGRNGLYTEELLKNLRTPGLSIVEVFQRTRNKVYRRSRGKQTPQDWNQLVGSIYLAGRDPANAPRGRQAPPPGAAGARIDLADQAAWEEVKDSKDIETLKDFQQLFPNSRYVPVVRLKIRKLQRQSSREKARQEAEQRRLANQRRLRDAEQRRLANQRRGRKEAPGNSRERRKLAAGRNEREAREFLAKNRHRRGVRTTASGLQYRVLRPGIGISPKTTDKVRTHYRGMLLDGTEFDSSYRRGKPATFQVNRVIKGWSEALQLMKIGSKWKLWLPAKLAYGARSVGSKIGPGALLVFEVELLDIQ